MLGQCKFVSCNERATLEWLSIVEKVVHLSEKGLYGNSVPSAKFCCEPELLYKKNNNKVFSSYFLSKVKGRKSHLGV